MWPAISLVTASWKVPRSRKLQMYCFRERSSTQLWSGTYSRSSVAKSGWPVIGHRQVNSGRLMRIVKSRSAAGLGKVARTVDGLEGIVSPYILSWRIMRLTKIKLAGFKSFVDPTSVGFPGNLTGVVGPNGCGKSNIIDAVRWVMGELSAKHLRGDSMADVVFNGSSARKPVGAASVELIFDNSDGKIGGAYASYNEVALKRMVARDGTSSYYMNGGRCRRKDITQLFLGTGLGSRSYAIIEQGMISRVIEARHEDMRLFIEEAAGVSLYKERRRETEMRMADTRENLARLQDLRDEIDKQIRHLQRQANSARRYQELKAQERALTAELLALRLRELDSGAAVQDGAVRACELDMQQALADQRSAEAAIEKQREYQ